MFWRDKNKESLKQQLFVILWLLFIANILFFLFSLWNMINLNENTIINLTFFVVGSGIYIYGVNLYNNL